MARRRSQLASRTSRAGLSASDAPEWELISPGVRLGYRRGRGTTGKGGTWLAASRGPDGKRVQTKLGRADDVHAPNGLDILSSEQAKDAARAWMKTLQVIGVAPAGPSTVNDILDKYLAARGAEGMKSLYDARSRAKTHIRPALGKLLVTQLTVEKVRQWRDSLVSDTKLRRTSKRAEKVNVQKVDLSDPETLRRRRDTANRTLTTLKSALNWAFRERLVQDDTAWRLVLPYRGTTSARVRFLSTAEQKALLEAAEGDLRTLVAAALMTGARFGELACLKVRDFDRSNGSVFVAESKSGKARHIPLTAGGVSLFERCTDKRAGDEPLLTRDGQAWKAATYQRPFKAAVAAAKLERISLHELRHSYASTMVRAGAPLIVVAEALGHADTRMVDRHYAHLAPSYVAETIRRTAPNLQI